MDVPEDLVALIRPAADEQEFDQAFPLVTVDAAGFPHVALLAAAQLDVDDAARWILASVAGPNTRRNLDRERRATLLAVDGIALHVAKLTVVSSVEAPDRAGYALRLEAHKRDSAGTALHPMLFARSAELVAAERWDTDAVVLDRLRNMLRENPEAPSTR